jgi:YgiT-type zinc finger domain-containing protein
VSADATSPWPARRERARELRARHAFAADVLTLYLALLDVQEQAWGAARESPPADVCAWTADRVLPAVIDATVASGPTALAEAVSGRAAECALAGWLHDDELEPVDRYLARASLGPVLEALGGEVGADGNGRCPRCAGLPQVAYLAASGEALVTGGRGLICARCAATWASSRGACPACGETDEGRLVVYSESRRGDDAVFPHLRVAGCSSCGHYLIDVDLERNPRAVPEVDELTALPLDLYAAEQGLTKLTANLMGF